MSPFRFCCPRHAERVAAHVTHAVPDGDARRLIACAMLRPRVFVAVVLSIPTLQHEEERVAAPYAFLMARRYVARVHICHFRAPGARRYALRAARTRDRRRAAADGATYGKILSSSERAQIRRLRHEAAQSAAARVCQRSPCRADPHTHVARSATRTRRKMLSQCRYFAASLCRAQPRDVLRIRCRQRRYRLLMYAVGGAVVYASYAIRMLMQLFVYARPLHCYAHLYDAAF